jgi:predicted dehydrogenase
MNLRGNIQAQESQLQRIEVYGTEGSLSVPDPNGFGGPVKLKLPQYKDWVGVNLTHPCNENFRGLGMADLAKALESGRPHRASGDLAFHVLDIMQAFHESGEQGKHIVLQSSCEKPAAFPTGLREGEVDS